MEGKVDSIGGGSLLGFGFAGMSTCVVIFGWVVVDAEFDGVVWSELEIGLDVSVGDCVNVVVSKFDDSVNDFVISSEEIIDDVVDSIDFVGFVDDFVAQVDDFVEDIVRFVDFVNFVDFVDFVNDFIVSIEEVVEEVIKVVDFGNSIPDFLAQVDVFVDKVVDFVGFVDLVDFVNSFSVCLRFFSSLQVDALSLLHIVSSRSQTEHLRFLSGGSPLVSVAFDSGGIASVFSSVRFSSLWFFSALVSFFSASVLASFACFSSSNKRYGKKT